MTESSSVQISVKFHSLDVFILPSQNLFWKAPEEGLVLTEKYQSRHFQKSQISLFPPLTAVDVNCSRLSVG